MRSESSASDATTATVVWRAAIDELGRDRQERHEHREAGEDERRHEEQPAADQRRVLAPGDVARRSA